MSRSPTAERGRVVMCRRVATWFQQLWLVSRGAWLRRLLCERWGRCAAGVVRWTVVAVVVRLVAAADGSGGKCCEVHI